MIESTIDILAMRFNRQHSAFTESIVTSNGELGKQVEWVLANTGRLPLNGCVTATVRCAGIWISLCSR